VENAKLTSLYFSVDRSGGPTACWRWQGSTAQDGSPSPVKYAGRVWGVHALIYSLVHNSIHNAGVQVSQQCNNRSCVNPAHLYSVALAPVPSAPVVATPGVPIPMRRLYAPQRAAMREAYRQGATQKALAQEYGVSIGNVVRTVRGARAKPERRTVRTITPAQQAVILALYAKGHSPDDIADHCAVAPQTVVSNIWAHRTLSIAEESA
jgi:hypothetical protein